ncbi:MAG: general secretion pathway protein GspL [Comamonadaceae bacterium]|nr:general secretion pathway protein GspL [Comamonadaceae bacterium]
MPVLIITPSDFSLASADGPTVVLSWATSANGQQVNDHGSCGASLLPADEDVVLVLPVRAVSWHRVAVPKVAASRLRAVLDGLLEERVLSDTGALHFALEPGGRAGQTVWVAACQKAWLQSWLQALEAAGRPVSRIVPALWPTAAGSGHTVHWAHDEGDRVWLATANPLGVRCVPLRENGSSTFGDSSFGHLGSATDSSTEHLLSGSDPANTQWFADPSITALAEQVCNQRFDLMPPPAWLLRCAQSDWNLAQFDLSLSSGARRGQRLRQTLRQWRSAPAWRPARWGLAALLAVQLLGLNAAAWHERSSLDAKRQAVRQTLQQTFPNVTLVLDAPLQMQRELALLQQASGSLSTGDLETMLAALAQAAPGEPATPGSADYSESEGRFGQWTAPEEQLRSLQQALQASGWQARFDGSTLSLRPAPP